MFEAKGSILREINGKLSFTVIIILIEAFTLFFITPHMWELYMVTGMTVVERKKNRLPISFIFPCSLLETE